MGRFATLSCFVLALFLLPVASRAQHDGALRPGDILNQGNWRKAEGLLPAEILKHYERGEYANPIVDWPTGIQGWGVDFRKGTEVNRGRFAVDERGTIIDKTTGRQPPDIIGFPFPDIDPTDPQAAIKILWNYFYQWWYSGNSHHVTRLGWVDRRGLEREAVQEVYFLYYDAQPRNLAPETNPNRLLMQFLATSVSPADLYGTTALDWRYRDAEMRDSVWAYVPALRRVRAVSPANRSDGFLGSDMSQDDGPFFDGKPEDFSWRFVGEAEMLRFVDPYSLKREVDFLPLPGGGWRLKRKEDPVAGYQISGWKGLPWAPVSLALAKRTHWIIEATPRDRYYLYGKILLAIDKETFDGSWNRKFTWQGELAVSFFNSRTLNLSPDGNNYFSSNPVAVLIAENMKLDRATIAGQPPQGVKEPFYDFRVPLQPDFFSYQTLLRFGK